LVRLGLFHQSRPAAEPDAVRQHAAAGGDERGRAVEVEIAEAGVDSRPGRVAVHLVRRAEAIRMFCVVLLLVCMRVLTPPHAVLAGG